MRGQIGVRHLFVWLAWAACAITSFAVLLCPAMAMADVQDSHPIRLEAAQSDGVGVQAGGAGTATDKIAYDGDENIAMTFAPIDAEKHFAQLAYAHLKPDIASSLNKPIDFVIPETVTDSSGVEWTVTAVGYDSKYATVENSDGGGGNYDLTDDAKTNGLEFDKNYFRSVTVPQTVTTMKSSCFRTWAIEEVNFAGQPNVESFGYGVFASCKALKAIDIPASVKELGGTVGPFSNSGLEKIVIPKTVEKITGAYTFQNCENLQEIAFESPETTIEASYLFSGCSGLKTVDFHHHPDVMGDYEFEKCTGLVSVDFADKGVEVSHGAFNGCKSLKTIEGASKVSILGSSSFVGTGLEEFSGFDSLAEIGDSAFVGCSNLKKVVIGPKCAVIGDQAFTYDSALADVVVESDVEKLTFGTKGGQVFYSGSEKNDTAASGSSLNIWFIGSVGEIVDYSDMALGRQRRMDHTTSFGSDNFTFMVERLRIYGPSSNESAVKAFFASVQNNPPHVYDPSSKAAGNPVEVSYAGLDLKTSALFDGNPAIPVIAQLNESSVSIEFLATKKEDGQAVQPGNLKDPGDYIITVTKVGDVEVDGPMFDFSITRSDAAQTAYDDIDSVTVPESAEDSEAIATAEQAALKALESYNALTDTEKASVGNYVSLLEKRVAIAELKVAAAEAKAATSDAKVAAVEQELNTVKEELKEAQAKLDAASASGATSAKQASKMTVKAKTVKAKAKKKTSLKAKKAFAVQGAAGKVTFKKISGNKKIKVSSSGKVTVKKGLKKKTYKVKVQVADAGNAQFAPVSKTVTLKVKVK